MHPDVQKLLELQRVDQELARVRRDLDSLPGEEARRRAQLDRLTQIHDAAHDELRHAEVKSREIEVGVKGSDEEIRKLEARLNQVRNNAEYQATLLQIESVKRERERLEEEGLTLLDSIEELRTRDGATRVALAAEQETFDAFLVEAQKIREACAAEVDEVTRRRGAAAALVPAVLLDTYNAMFKTRSSVAVCAVEGNVCTGCYTNIKPNDLARLKGASTIVQCGSCQRILYLSE